MTDAFAWKQWQGSRATLPSEVVDAIDAVGQELGRDAEDNAILSALRSRNVGFLQAIMGLMAIKDVRLGDAKWIVHGSSAYADHRQDREDFWAAMHDEVMNDPEVQQQSTAADRSERSDEDTPHPG